MNDRLEVPKFASEEEEANWWFENRGKLKEEFLEAALSGQLRSGSTALRRAREALNATAIRLSDSDLAAIRHLTAQRGQDEDTCAASILHRALEKDTPDHGVDRH
jgi:hypothetical protein